MYFSESAPSSNSSAQQKRCFDRFEIDPGSKDPERTGASQVLQEKPWQHQSWRSHS